jgi:hypothetical protein
MNVIFSKLSRLFQSKIIKLFLLGSLITSFGCQQDRASFVEDALSELERSGFQAFAPYLTPAGRKLVDGLDLAAAAGPGAGGELICHEVKPSNKEEIHKVVCKQGESTLEVTVVDTTKGPRIDLFAMQFDQLLGGQGDMEYGGNL